MDDVGAVDAGGHRQVGRQDPQRRVGAAQPGIVLGVGGGPVAGFAHAVDVEVHERAQVAGQEVDVHAGAAVDVRRVLPGDQGDAHAGNLVPRRGTFGRSWSGDEGAPDAGAGCRERPVGFAPVASAATDAADDEGGPVPKYLLLKHYRADRTRTDRCPRWTSGPEDVDAHMTFLREVSKLLEERGEYVDAQALTPERSWVRYGGPERRRWSRTARTPRRATSSPGGT